MTRRQLIAGGVALGAAGGLRLGERTQAAEPASFSEYQQLDGLALAELVKNKEVSAKELLDAAIARVEQVNPAINAVNYKHYDLAYDAIRAGLPEGPFTGVPFLLKDLHAYLKGTITSNGSTLYQDTAADYDSTLVSRYKAAGLVIFGKTASPEFGLNISTEPKIHGPTGNPWDPTRIAGGSSGGAGAAVAARMAPIAHASDGGGSIRIPAAMCGVFGLKPTRGRTPFGPKRAEGWGGLSINHVITRSVRDSAAMLDATHGREIGAPYYAPPVASPFLNEVETPPGRLRIAVNTKPRGNAEVDPDCAHAVASAAKLCEDLGHQVEDATPDIDTETKGRAQGVIVLANTSASLQQRAQELGRELTPKDVEAWTWQALKAAESMSAADYVNAVTTIHGIGRQMAIFHETYDVLLEPVTTQPPMPLGYFDMDSDDLDTFSTRLFAFLGYTALYNLTGQPSMSVPLYWTDAGLPVGTMFSARFGDEATLFRLAAQLEQARPWANKQPQL